MFTNFTYLGGLFACHRCQPKLWHRQENWDVHVKMWYSNRLRNIYIWLARNRSMALNPFVQGIGLPPSYLWLWILDPDWQGDEKTQKRKQFDVVLTYRPNGLRRSQIGNLQFRLRPTPDTSGFVPSTGWVISCVCTRTDSSLSPSCFNMRTGTGGPWPLMLPNTITSLTWSNSWGTKHSESHLNTWNKCTITPKKRKLILKSIYYAYHFDSI